MVPKVFERCLLPSVVGQNACLFNPAVMISNSKEKTDALLTHSVLDKVVIEFSQFDENEFVTNRTNLGNLIDPDSE